MVCPVDRRAPLVVCVPFESGVAELARRATLPSVTDRPEHRPSHPPVADLRAGVAAGGAERYHAANAAKGKLFARERVARLVDEGSFVEDGAARQRRWPVTCRPTAS